MKTLDFLAIVAAAKESKKNVANDVKELNKNLYSLSKLLRDLNSKEMLPVWFSILEGIGLPLKLYRPSHVLEMLQPQQLTADKHNNLLFVVWNKRAVKDDAGEFVLDEKGEKVYEEKASTFKENNWTLNKLVAILTQCVEFTKANAAK